MSQLLMPTPVAGQPWRRERSKSRPCDWQLPTKGRRRSEVHDVLLRKRRQASGLLTLKLTPAPPVASPICSASRPNNPEVSHGSQGGWSCLQTARDGRAQGPRRARAVASTRAVSATTNPASEGSSAVSCNCAARVVEQVKLSPVSKLGIPTVTLLPMAFGGSSSKTLP